MNTDNNSISFGRYLIKKRLEKGIALKVLAEETRIGLNTLVWIENEDIEKLPAEVFTKGFLRAYAKAVGADPDEAVRLYQHEMEGHLESEKFERELSKTSVRFWPRFIGTLVLFCGIVAGAIFIFAGPQDRLWFLGRPAEKPHAREIETPKSPTTDEGSAPAAAVVPAVNVPEKLLLKVAAAKSTWMKVIIDGQDTQEYRLNTGDNLELEAASGFNILIGDAKAVKLSLNNKPYAVPGKSGQVVTVQIP